MKNKILFQSIVIIAAFSIIASAQNIGDYRGILSQKTTFEPTKISVEEARYIGINYITASDSVLMKNCGIILRRDLDYSPFIEIGLFDKLF